MPLEIRNSVQTFGVENMGFRGRKRNTVEWKTGQLTSKAQRRCNYDPNNIKELMTVVVGDSNNEEPKKYMFMNCAVSCKYQKCDKTTLKMLHRP